MASPQAQESAITRARCVALTQEHRGHGVSTAAYFLARMLVRDGLRVLLVDLTGRRGRLHALCASGAAKNLGLWSPSLARPADLAPLLAEVRRQTAGKVDVLLLDADGALLERARALAAARDATIDYAAVVTDSSPSGQVAADTLARALGDEPPPFGRVGAIFSRVDGRQAKELPERTEGDGLPVLGYFPADYLLAADEDYLLKGAEAIWPHDDYLNALLRLGRTLTRLVPLHRAARSVQGEGALLSASGLSAPDGDGPATSAQPGA